MAHSFRRVPRRFQQSKIHIAWAPKRCSMVDLMNTIGTSRGGPKPAACGRSGPGLSTAIFLALAAGCRPAGSDGAAAGGGYAEASVRLPVAAGTFYPDRKDVLVAQVQELIIGAKSNAAPGLLRGAVVPHAGYVYSGRAAAGVYRLVRKGQYPRVIILAPSHAARFVGIALPAEDVAAFRTPLGDIPVARAVCADLAKKPGFSRLPGVDRHEHSIEVQLPFLQETAGNFELVPLLCGAIGEKDVEGLGKTLGPLLDAKTLILASSDFTHYGPNYGFVPFDKDVKANLDEWLRAAAEAITALDAAAFRKHCSEKEDTICGRVPIELLVATLRSSGVSVQGRTLDMYLSGDIVGDYRNSVSYAAIGFFSSVTETKKEGTVKEHKSGTWSPGLSEEEKRTLFAIARDTLEWSVNGRRKGFSLDAYSLTPRLKEKCATFVTYKNPRRGEDDLRGCMGCLEAVEPMGLSVHTSAANAARDFRFAADPITSGEIQDIVIHVSLLSPRREIASPDDFKIGEHGIWMEKGIAGAVFLPEVAVEQKWTREETLSHLCRKAGLPGNAWRSGARFKVFESVVLSE